MKLYSNISIYFLIWIASLIFIFFFGLNNFPYSGQSKDLIGSLANWDGGHYLSIASNGYREKFQYAFFPLYPMTINLVSQITGDYLTAALIVSSLSAFLALHLFYGLVSLDFSKRLAEKAVLLLLIFPTSFYLITAYSEGFFLLLVIASFYFLRKDKLFLATLFAVLAGATRLSGLAVAAALIIHVIVSGGISKKNWIVTLAPLGFVIYCIFLFKTTGDPFYFLSAESTNWQRSLAVPGLSFWETIKSLTRPQFLSGHFNNFLELVFAVFGLGMVFRSFRFLPAGYAVYGLLSILLPIATNTLVSIPRFLLPIFPIFIVLGLVENQKVIFLIELLFVMLLSAFSMLFINGYWVS